MRLFLPQSFLSPVPIRSLLRLLTLLLGIFYLDTVCQTDAEDARAYYARGIPEYVAGAVAAVVAQPAALPAAPLRQRWAVANQLATKWQRRQAARAFFCPLGPPLVVRRWLRCGVLQV